jgi:hypothetical protein
MEIEVRRFFNTDKTRKKKTLKRVIIEEEEEKDFRKMIPGSPEWIIFWVKNPDLQDAMLRFKKKGGYDAKKKDKG